MLFEFSAVTVNVNADPAVAVAGAETVKWVAVLTAIPGLVPVIDKVIVSVAVIVLAPSVRSVALNVPVPLVSVEFAGSVALPSLLVKWTVPA